MINGRSLIGLTHQEAVDVLRNAPRLIQLVVAAKVIIHPNSGYLDISKSKFIPNYWYLKVNFLDPENLL